MLTAFVGEPARLTVAQMDRWARDFDNWAICDALCFHLFDKSPHAFGRIAAWSRRREEFVRRAAFALLAGVALHRKSAPDAPFLRALALAKGAARDERNFVKKGVSWGLRSVGHRNVTLHAATLSLARQLAASAHPTERWVGHDVIRDLSRPLVARKLKRRPAPR
jgi:3-methyladenine DNA glycosylase AlkD